MHKNLVETLVGTGVLLVAVLFAFYTFSTTNSTSRNSYSLLAQFQSVQGVGIGTAVKISGIKVGTVRSVKLDPTSFLAMVELTINDEVKIPDDSIVTIGSEGLLGGNYIRLLVGGSDGVLKNGDRFQYSQGAVDLSDLLGKVFMSAGTNVSAGKNGNDAKDSGKK
ncbi:MAG: outer membrane lipid asymmetry maintenance protein MlaD [Candidatus Pacebacteria bacterium]|nr:outer membrane lipid asymmetry maintenance protein MlaD [Candidatus Paceibacterota bacterium]